MCYGAMDEVRWWWSEASARLNILLPSGRRALPGSRFGGLGAGFCALLVEAPGLCVQLSLKKYLLPFIQFSNNIAR